MKKIVVAALVDVVAILLFVAIGRGSHAEDATLLGFLTTAWPFLAGAAFGWALSLAWRRPLAILPTGIAVWVAAIVAGMLLRTISGQGVQPAFVIVTAIVLGALLVGWRAAALLIRTLRSRHRTT